jgi:hypothetical protein
MPTMPSLSKKPSFHRMASINLPDYFLSWGNKNEYQERIICNLWLLLLTGYMCYQFPSLMVLVWLLSADYILAQTTFGLDRLDHHNSPSGEPEQQLVPDASSDSNTSHTASGEQQLVPEASDASNDTPLWLLSADNVLAHTTVGLDRLDHHNSPSGEEQQLVPDASDISNTHLKEE